jgi:CBS domain-containing protein
MRRMSDIVRNQNPLTLPPTATVRSACESMRKRKVGAVLVTDKRHRLLGIFTGRDAIGRVIAEGKDPEKTTLADVMTEKPKCMPSGQPAIEALRLMQDTGCRHVPIIDDGKLVGVVSKADFRGIEVDRLDEETGLWDRI